MYTCWANSLDNDKPLSVSIMPLGNYFARSDFSSGPRESRLQHSLLISVVTLRVLRSPKPMSMGKAMSRAFFRLSRCAQ